MKKIFGSRARCEKKFVIGLVFERILDENVMKIQNRALPKFEIELRKPFSKSEIECSKP